MWCSPQLDRGKTAMEMTLCIHLFNNKAHITLGVRAKKLGANFEHFWVANWSQVTNKC